MELLQLAEKLAELKNTEVLAHRYSEDGTELTFVLGSGPKLTMNAEQLRAALREAQPSEPFDYIEHAAAQTNEEHGSHGSALRASPPADGDATPEPPKTKTKKKGKVKSK